MTAKLSPGERRRAVMMWVGAVMLMLAVVGGGAVQTQRWARAEAAKAVPSGGFYWPVAQYQLAYASLKEDLLSTALGRQSDPEALARSWSVLTSRAGVLVEPSEVRTLYERVPGYAQATRRIAELLSRISPVLDHPPISPADVIRVLEELKVAGHENILTELDNAARQTELAAQESLLNGLSNRLGWIWAGFGLSWALLGLWLLNVIQSSRRLAMLSAERQKAVRAMEAAIGVKRRFVSMVSHESRSPLQSIVTSAESLSQDLDLVSSRPQSVAAIRRIRTAIAGLRAQLRDLLTIARGDSGQLGTQLETFDCSELVDDVCEDFRELARAKGLQLDVDLPDQSTLVQADPIRIAQVVRNLLENAIRYTASGKVSVKLQVVDAEARLRLRPGRRCI